jgi:hypothetical protein
MLGSLSLKLIFLILSLVCFGLAFFGVPKYSWQNGGFFFALLCLVS